MKELGQELSQKLDYQYPLNDHINVAAYLEKVRAYPSRQQDERQPTELGMHWEIG